MQTRSCERPGIRLLADSIASKSSATGHCPTSTVLHRADHYSRLAQLHPDMKALCWTGTHHSFKSPCARSSYAQGPGRFEPLQLSIFEGTKKKDVLIKPRKATILTNRPQYTGRHVLA